MIEARIVYKSQQNSLHEAASKYVKLYDYENGGRTKFLFLLDKMGGQLFEI